MSTAPNAARHLLPVLAALLVSGCTADGEPNGPGGEDNDGDGIANIADNCPSVVNVAQSDLDHDALGDACDTDLDGDAIANVTDNCVANANASQEDADSDAVGNACDSDDDGDRAP